MIGAEQESRYAVMGALALYLDFINMFLFLLRIFGRRASRPGGGYILQ